VDQTWNLLERERGYYQQTNLLVFFVSFFDNRFDGIAQIEGDLHPKRIPYAIDESEKGE